MCNPIKSVKWQNEYSMINSKRNMWLKTTLIHSGELPTARSVLKKSRDEQKNSGEGASVCLDYLTPNR